mgnify:CR=1 FL=1
MKAGTVRAEPVSCPAVRPSLAGVADGTLTLEASAQRHLETCLRCQADLAQYRKLLRSLRALRTEVRKPAPGLLEEIFASLEGAGQRRSVRGLLSGRRVAYLGGLAAATAAGAASAIVLASRSRRRMPLAG